jgi:hypothetical protein
LDILNPNSLNTARRHLAGAGIQTAALGFGGYSTASTGATEEYDGTSWTTIPGSKYSKNVLGRSRDSNFCFSFWWLYCTSTAVTEEYTGAAPTTVTITAS